MLLLTKRVNFTFLLVLLSLSAFTQKESNVWCFGDKYVLNFNTTPPSISASSAMSTFEGSTSISDSSGNLLFYSDGQTVWDKNHNIMPNGTDLGGNKSVTQSAIILKIDDDRYFLFTLDKLSGNGSNGLQYNIVDMRLNGGKGNLSLKNVSLNTSDLSEKLVIAEHSDGQSYWVIIKARFAEQYFAYKVTGATVSTTPVVSTFAGAPSSGVGQMKVSPSHDKIALTGMTNILVCDFNRTTGKVSNQRQIHNGVYGDVYGVEFSQDGRLLYAGAGQTAYKLLQYDLSLPTTTQIIQSEMIVGNGPASAYAGSLQTGPDGKIYLINASASFQYLGIINKPMVRGIGCNFDPDGIALPSGAISFGLPNYFTGYVPGVDIVWSNTCIGDTVKFSFTDYYPYDSVFWDFGDTVSGLNNFSSQKSPTHYYSKAGKYDIKISTHLDSTVFVIKRTVEVYPYPEVSLGKDTTICEGEEVYISLYEYTPADFLWSDNSTNYLKFLKAEGNYWVKVTKNGCATFDTIVVNVDEYYNYYLPKDTFLCDGDSVSIDIGAGADSYNWSTGSTSSSASFKSQDTFTVITTSGVCKKVDSIFVEVKPLPLFNLGADSTICSTDSITLNGTANVKHDWSMGDTNQSITIRIAGEYILKQRNEYCDYSDTINITVQQQPSINIGNDTVVCLGEKVIIGNTIPNGTQYKWSHTSTGTPKVVINQQDEYSVIAYDGICYAYDSIFLGVYSPQSINLGQDTVLCEGTETELDATIIGGKYQWNDGVQTPTRIVNTDGAYLVQITDSVCQYSDTITVTFNARPILDLGPDTALCQDEVHLVTVNSGWDRVNWDDGRDDFTRIFTSEGTYRVTAGYLNCEETDSIIVRYHPPLPDLNLGDDKDVCDPLFVPLFSGYNGYYGTVWQDGTKGDYYEVTETGDYIISTLPHRCGQISDTVHINFLRQECNLHIPNAFTPNGDGENDFFFPIGHLIEIESMEIYNRWGELIYNKVEPWDGKYGSEILPNGSYVYIIAYKKEYKGSPKRLVVKGTVQILR